MKKKIMFVTLLVLLAFLCGCSLIEKTKAKDRTELPKITYTSVPTTHTIVKPATTPNTTEVPPLLTTTEPILSEEARAYEILQDMTLEEKVGQMFFVRCPEGDTVSAVKTWHLGGYVLFARDFDGKTAEQIIERIAAYQNVSPIPMLIGTDEEGGTVVRISRYRQFRTEPFLSPQALFDAGGLDLIRSDTEEKAILLKLLGLNVNLAPVCDVSINPNDFIYDRSFGQPAEETAKYVEAVVEEMVSQRIGCVLKHFPGYGNNEDTHTAITYDNRSYDTFETSDFLPFSAGIDAGARAVMVSHNIVACMDSQLPASLSPAVHEILRNKLGFDGVIMTDDLSMDAVQDYTDGEAAAVLAILAGNDLLVSTDFEVQISAVLKAVENGEISEDGIDESVTRILMWKRSFGIIS